MGKNYDITVGVNADLFGIGNVGHGYFINRKSGIYNLQHYQSLKDGSVYERVIGETGGNRTWKKLVSNSDVVDIPAVDIPVGDFVLTSTNIVYQSGDIPVVYGTGGHGAHMIVTPCLVDGKWSINRRNTYSVTLNSTAARLYVLR